MNTQQEKQLKKRNTELEKKLALKKLELEIETSLEKVRAIAMSMKAPADMQAVCKTISLQLQSLGVEEIRNIQTAIFYESRGTYINYEYYAKHNKTFITETIYTNHKQDKAFAASMLKGKDEFFITHIKGKKVMEWIAFQKTTNVFIDRFLEKASSLNYYWYSLGQVALGISTYVPLTPNELHLFKRFLKVFELAYRRFMDIELAVAQAKEARIETALERVISRSMGMQKSEELKEVIQIVFEQLRQLNFNVDSAHFNLNFKESDDYNLWSAAPNQPYPVKTYIPFFDHPVFIRAREAKEKGLDFFTESYTQEEKNTFFEHLFKHTPLIPAERRKYILSCPGVAASTVLMNTISLWIMNYAGIPFSEVENMILKRFGKIFEQSYTRFLDLQKAEAQAREEKIEAALENVRASSMAMHHSEELEKVVKTLSVKFIDLGLSLDGAFIFFFEKEKRNFHLWLATNHLTAPIKVHMLHDESIQNNPIIRDLWRAIETGSDFINESYSGKVKDDYFRFVAKNNELKIPEAIRKFQLEAECWTISLAAGKNSVVGIDSWSGKFITQQDFQVLKRFAKVFEQAYTRFLDLQKAEAQAREAIKASSLDRVRGEIASMRNTSDLDRITPLIWKELTALGISFIRCGVFIMDEQQNQAHSYLSTPEGSAIAAFNTPLETPGNLAGAIDNWYKQKIYVTHWVEKDFIVQADELIQQGAITSRDKYLNTLPKEGFHLHFLPFMQGMLYVGSMEPLQPDDLQLVQALADAFSVAYARYEDLTNLEAAKQQVEKTLADLKQAQQQLVQSEKMASLGELTAGIAHEIQNPLNFVNNFSEVNKEMLVELSDEIDKGNYADAKSIAKDVIANEEKINHHGKRADAIVKGMLQHSRKSEGVSEPTDINALCDEYLRLSYHGLRAKDKEFNATIKTDFDESIGTINIIPQDIGRVLLNLYNNAFYAVNEKKKITKEVYQPTVFLSSKKTGDKVILTVKDNGNGIPQKVVGKIFQPFFTTKPTGQGTGLGLSLSYDIIKAHGGEIKVETKEGEFTEFIIHLPVNEKELFK